MSAGAEGEPYAGFGGRAVALVLGGIAFLPWPLLILVIGNHIASPDISRGTIYETVHRLMQGLEIYPAPSGDFVALDYNPLLYVLCAGAARLFGLSPATLRLVVAIGSLAAAALVFLAVRRATRSAFLGLLACGLFAAAYRTFDCYIDQQQPDSWMLLTALAGLMLLQDGTRPRRIAAGVALLCAAFWFKQQGALLAAGGVLYLTWKIGWRRAVPWWLLAALLGPVAWYLLGPRLFGTDFIYYTWEVPHTYSRFRLRGLLHAGWFAARFWAIPAGVVLWGLVDRRWRPRSVDIWTFTFPFALLIGWLGSMDYSEHNVYIAPATWLIILGAITLQRMAASAAALPPARRRRAATAIAAGVAFSFLAQAYDPRTVMVPARAWLDYDALLAQVRALDGNVYMPGVGQLPGDVRLPVPVHWVPLEDLVRGHGYGKDGDPLVRAILKDVQYPAGEAWIIADRPLHEDTLLAFLAPHYTLVEDMGQRYATLRAQPGWYSGRSWPRYLYRSRAAPTAGQDGTLGKMP